MPSSDPKQQKLRDRKKSWNKKIRDFTNDLISIKKVMNGAPSKFHNQVSSIKDPIPSDPASVLGVLASDFNQIVNEGNAIINDQIMYSQTRRQKQNAPNPNQTSFNFAADDKVVEASNKLTRFFSRMKGPLFFGPASEKEKRILRLNMLQICVELEESFKELQEIILSSEKDAIEKADRLIMKVEKNILVLRKYVLHSQPPAQIAEQLQVSKNQPTDLNEWLESHHDALKSEMNQIDNGIHTHYYDVDLYKKYLIYKDLYLNGSTKEEQFHAAFTLNGIMNKLIGSFVQKNTVTSDKTENSKEEVVQPKPVDDAATLKAIISDIDLNKDNFSYDPVIYGLYLEQKKALKKSGPEKETAIANIKALYQSLLKSLNEQSKTNESTINGILIKKALVQQNLVKIAYDMELFSHAFAGKWLKRQLLKLKTRDKTSGIRLKIDEKARICKSISNAMMDSLEKDIEPMYLDKASSSLLENILEMKASIKLINDSPKNQFFDPRFMDLVHKQFDESSSSKEQAEKLKKNLHNQTNREVAKGYNK